ncbi:phosphate ABC transporter membrane protein 1, PhoT family [Frankia sp. CcI6]|jgi:phosphate transport system permease protein|uniref:Phosphate transport system permease protein n=1 Tax=Frankia casuarinae (strain DSM 45818 / CECT 9043 / HFP020203 / CcI3) TaxID=106370 RepID=Q2J532_FRACC|nr:MULTISPECIES: phosphate ABC transporter permease subunit PstC [Frankia]ABD13610.1 phosphate ABC transporter membrane protein 1, PhoT family [Frankia casuarinae]ETA02569.1 phosphate ABC transporter membrane protein 1, PhoT family [Frankia sp. CcI6]KDA42065.1 phosphate ABC transporter membrane protein 1, PhoT family [Frankia sp. BMG5.23]OHV49637.1 phosphate ABC transporter permease subunit PstC [Frankia sp. CgIS1]ORT47233.1 phosphate ABC transporter permease subunit PstC [Frankia sp. KB5]
MTTEPDSSADAESRGAASATAPSGGDRPAGGLADTSTGKAKVGVADLIFKNATRTAGVGLLVLIAAIAAFLVLRATDALGANTGNFFTTEEWFPNATPPVFGIAALLFGTMITAAIAMIIAVPVAVGIALFITVYAPRRMASALGYIVDLLAAVPSVVYGLWGLLVLAPHMKGIQSWLTDYFGWIPLFETDRGVGRSIFVASVVLAIMILPIVAALSREVFLQVPSAHREAAMALGATRWEMIRTAVLPYGKPGVISASMLGLGRAMGETIAVALVLPASFNISWQILAPAGNTIAANVANGWGEANDIGRGALIASGLVLFIVTMLVNIIARAIIARRREFLGSAA